MSKEEQVYLKLMTNHYFFILSIPSLQEEKSFKKGSYNISYFDYWYLFKLFQVTLVEFSTFLLLLLFWLHYCFNFKNNYYETWHYCMTFLCLFLNKDILILKTSSKISSQKKPSQYAHFLHGGLEYEVLPLYPHLCTVNVNS